MRKCEALSFWPKITSGERNDKSALAFQTVPELMSFMSLRPTGVSLFRGRNCVNPASFSLCPQPRTCFTAITAKKESDPMQIEKGNVMLEVRTQLTHLVILYESEVRLDVMNSPLPSRGLTNFKFFLERRPNSCAQCAETERPWSTISFHPQLLQFFSLGMRSVTKKSS